MIELFLDGERVDISSSARIGSLPITFKIGDITNPSDAGISYSLRMNLPISQNNQSFFGFPEEIASNAEKIYQVFEADYWVNGVPIIQKGKAYFLEVTSNFYAITVRTDNNNFWESISKKTIADLDFLSEDDGMFWDLDTMYALRNSSSSLVVPLADWGTLSDSSNDFTVKTSFFCYYFKSLIAKIEAHSGYTFSGSIFSDTLYQNLALSMMNTHSDSFADRMQIQAASDIVTGNCFVYGVFSSTKTFKFSDVSTDNFSVISEAINYTNEVEFTSIQNIVTTHSETNQIKILKTGVYHIQIDIDYSYTNGTIPEIEVRSSLTANTLYYYSIPASNYPNLNNNSTSFSLHLEKGEVIDFGLYTNENNEYLLLTSLEIDIQFEADKNTETKIEFGDPLELKGMLPDWKLYECIEQFTKLFNQFIRVDEFSKTVHFFSLADIYSNISNALDWSSKLQDKSHSISPKYFSLSQKNNLKFLYDKDENYPTKATGFADSYLEVENESLSPEKDFIKMKTAASQDVPRLGGLMSLLYLFEIDGSETKSLSIKPRLLELSSFTENVNWTDGSSSSSTSSQKIAQSGNLQFNNIIEEYFSEFQEVMRKPKIVTAQFHLTEADINQMDFSKPVYVSAFSSYFIVNEIKNYIPNKLTTVELIQLK